ncbi:MAG: hypothetical protein WAT51_02230 [Holophaga sp.]
MAKGHTEMIMATVEALSPPAGRSRALKAGPEISHMPKPKPYRDNEGVVMKGFHAAIQVKSRETKVGAEVSRMPAGHTEKMMATT